MKKIFSILIVLLACVFCLPACNRDKETEEQKYLRLYDLNKDGVVENWESPFAIEGDSVRTKIGGVVSVSNVQELISFTNQSSNGVNYNRGVLLTQDIDFGGEKVGNLDLGGAILYGNNKIISGFILKDIFDNTGSPTNPDTGLGSICLFKNASAVYDTKIYVGNQILETKQVIIDSNIEFSILRNCGIIENVHTKGRMEINNNVSSLSSLQVSFLSIDGCKEDYDYAKKETEDPEVFDYLSFTLQSIQDCTSTNRIVILEKEDSYYYEKLSVSGLWSTSKNIENKITAKDSKVDTQMDIQTKALYNQVGGMFANTNKSFIEDCSVENFDIKLNATLGEEDGKQLLIVGGIVGVADADSEIKNSTAQVNILAESGYTLDTTTEEKEYTQQGVFSIGGIVGINQGLLYYNISRGEIVVNGTSVATVGGLIGTSVNSIIIKNISNIDIEINKTRVVYVAGLSGNAVGGMFELCIANGKVLVNGEKEKMDTISIGLLFFHSRFFFEYYNFFFESYLESSTPIDEDLFYLWDTHYSIEDPQSSDPKYIIHSPIYSPSLSKNFALGENVVVVESIEGEEITTDYLEKNVNIGGYWWWCLENTGKIQPIIFGILYSHNSSLKVNNIEKILYNNDNWIKTLPNLTYTMLIHQIGFYTTEMPEPIEPDFSIESLEFVNFKKGSYFSPENTAFHIKLGSMVVDYNIDTIMEIQTIFSKVISDYSEITSRVTTYFVVNTDYIFEDDSDAEGDENDADRRIKFKKSYNISSEEYSIENLYNIKKDMYYAVRTDIEDSQIFVFNTNFLEKVDGLPQLPEGFRKAQETDFYGVDLDFTNFEYSIMHSFMSRSGVENFTFSFRTLTDINGDSHTNENIRVLSIYNNLNNIIYEIYLEKEFVDGISNGRYIVYMNFTAFSN